MAVGLVNADSRPACAADAGQQAFAHGAANPRRRLYRRYGRRGALGAGAQAGGGDVAGHAVLPIEALEHIARVLLRRYGVVFWRLLAREADWLPPRRELLRVYHRLEARGEIRGGRFVAGVAGEQFALPEALALLREVRKRPLAGELLAVSAVDPLNQLGTLLPGSKVPALPGNRILYRDGVPLAALVAGKPQWLLDLDEPAQREALRRLTSTGR